MPDRTQSHLDRAEQGKLHRSRCRAAPQILAVLPISNMRSLHGRPWRDKDLAMSGLLPRLGRLALIASLTAVVAVGIGPATHPAPVRAATADTMESELLGWVNSARAGRGLLPLRLLPSLVTFAGDRAATMASAGVMAHPSCFGCLLNDRSIPWYTCGEDIALTTYPWGDQAALSIFNGWKGSSGHWAILMSSTFNYIGFGVAYRSSNHTTYAAADLTESIDQTSPWARMVTDSHSGTTVSWTWTGGDTKLQTHTSWLKNYDVQYQVDNGSWVTIRSGTTAKSLSLTSRAHGHYYSLRIRSRDYRGYVSSYTTALRIWLP
jgi:uncharacterized protein YkwD